MMMMSRNVSILGHKYLAVRLVTQGQFAIPPHQPSCCVNSLLTRWRPPAVANLLPPFKNLSKNPEL